MMAVLGRTEPTVLALTVENALDIKGGAGFQRVIVEKVCQRNKTVEPVGHPFPIVAAASDPHAVADIGPDGIKMPRKRICLQAKLGFQPSLG